MTAPALDSGYSLILLDVGSEARRVVRAAIRVRQCGADEAIAVLRGPLPLRVASGLTDAAAQQGQWEFASCDCIAVYVRDAVVESGEFAYLRDLFHALRRSPEFDSVPLRIESIPETAPARRFLDQFVGSAETALPVRVQVTKQKARLMEFFGAKVGAVVQRC